ncbi:uncharacterized protein LOC103717628 isoform X2 [Phoenix dactylifera]|uniref:Uncharacterized protein LOC103717628 isoform X2 n=1 Tax=Phoenix dactylifera TaxID=42345 RepID=A0A8B9A8A8_PHODC|nr:uncharacterized protein LOC103717628 isoform X2 [Phoenix dactylifera]
MMAKAAAAKKGRPRKKRKGRIARPDPPLPVLLRRPPPPPSRAPEPPRRTLRPRRRRRSLHDFTEDEEEERGRRKLKLVLKLPNITPSRRDERCSDSPARAPRSRRIPSSGHVASSSSSASSSSYVDDDEEDGEEAAEGEETIKPPKKRRIEGCDDGVGSDGSRDLERGRKNVLRRCSKGSFSELSSKSFAGTPLPERKTLEAILDKLQKKDTYGVFAEPVDPEELPDYHDVIEHPMDFGTIRKKLASNAYLSFEQYEDDVFLICSNAMQYNAPDTIYFRQARSIQDMARQKFQKLRVDGKCAETAGKTEEKIKFNSMEKKPLMKALSRTAQEPLVSDISSAATLASTGDTGTGLSMTQANGVEAPVVDNGFADGSSSLGESKSEKADELSARSSPAKLGRKPFVIDENRRATYNMSEQQSVIEPDSMFDVYEGEMRQLVAVGLNAEDSYARSLARFSASLGPIAWEIASKTIEKALPAGVKFGPGWVREFEPLQTPVLSLENHNQRQLGLNPDIQFKLASRKDKEAKERLQATQNCESKDIRLGRKRQITTGVSNKACNLVKGRDYHQRTTKLKQGLSGVTAETQPSVAGAGFQLQKKATVNSAKAHTNVSEHVRPRHSTSVSGIPVETALQRPDNHSEPASFRSPGIISWDWNNGQPGHLKQPEAAALQSRNEVLSMEFWKLSNGKATGNSGSCRPGTTLGLISEHQPGTAGNFLACGSLEQGINNHSRLIGLQIFNQPNISNKVIDAPKPFSSAVIPSGRENTSAAAAAAARAWMSIGASAECKAVAGKGLPNNQVGFASLHKFAWKTPNSPSGIHEDSKTRHVPQFFQQPNQVTSEESKVHDKELVIFPQLVATDLKRFHGQSPWQGLIPQTEQKQSKDVHPPDLNINIGFQLPGSPVHQSAGIHKDSQQPDLALQL